MYSTALVRELNLLSKKNLYFNLDSTTTSVTLDKLLVFSHPQFPHLEGRDTNLSKMSNTGSLFYTVLLSRSNEIMDTKMSCCLEISVT